MDVKVIFQNLYKMGVFVCTRRVYRRLGGEKYVGLVHAVCIRGTQHSDKPVQLLAISRHVGVGVTVVVGGGVDVGACIYLCTYEHLSCQSVCI